MKATTDIVTGMHRHEIRRYIGLGTPAVTVCPPEHPTAWVHWHRTLTRCLRPGTLQQMTRTPHEVTQTELDWTIARLLHTSIRPARELKHVGHLGLDAVDTSPTDLTSCRQRASPATPEP